MKDPLKALDKMTKKIFKYKPKIEKKDSVVKKAKSKNVNNKL